MSYVECIFWARNQVKIASEAGDFGEFTNYQKVEETWKFILANNINNAIRYKTKP